MGVINDPEKYAKYLEIVKNFRLLDDDFMTKYFEDRIEESQFVLRTLFDDPTIEVVDVEVQKEVKNLQGHSIRLDVFAITSKGSMYDLEIQRASSGGQPKRARYNSGILDANTLQKGEEYETLPETYVVFFTEKDIFGKGLPVYHIERVILETDEFFDDKEHVVYVNAAYEGNDAIGKLVHDFREPDPEKMFYKELSRRAQELKGDPEEVNEMCEAVEKLVSEGEAKGEAKGKSKERTAIIKKLLGKGKSVEEIVDFLEFPESEVQSVVSALQAESQQ